MSSGIISKNTAPGSGGGVVVVVYNYGTFTMNGGTISGNSAELGQGGGVFNIGNYPPPVSSR